MAVCNLKWILVLCFLIKIVTARDCSDIENIGNCNECFRCGGHWCNRPTHDSPRCTLERYQGWCPNDQEMLKMPEDTSIPGNNSLSPVYLQRTALIGVTNRIPVVYKSTKELTTNIAIVNTTQTFDVKVQSRTKCDGEECTVIIETTPGIDFCSTTGRVYEAFSLKMSINGLEDDVDVKYHVPCACRCSERQEKNSSVCNHHGDYSCGTCSCWNGWNGEFCNEKECPANRGDIQCQNPENFFVDCSGNGYCGPCETCECFTDRPGSQYFDKNNYCTDLCMVTNNCDTCLENPNYDEVCQQCSSPLNFHPYNKTVFVEEKDYLGRNVWVRCNMTLEDNCYVEYAVMKQDEEINVMMIKGCGVITAPPLTSETVKVTVPVILGVLGILAATAAILGYVLYKQRSPPLPFSDPLYSNIGAEDCTGENPLYKPPTSSFKNPTYGKW